jgi:integrase
MLQHHPHRPLSDFWGEPAGSRHAPILSRSGVSEKSGAVHRPFLTKHRLPVPEIRTLPEENTREGFFTRTEVDALVAALPENLRDFARWAFVTGWRKGEIASLRWADVDWDGRSAAAIVAEVEEQAGPHDGAGGRA